MTLQQLKYIVEIAEQGSISRASQTLYISQPSLSAAVKELEDELGITIFTRSNKGVSVSAEGTEFLGYARQVLSQVHLMEDRYMGEVATKQHFSVSTHHYMFAINAFIDLVNEFGGDEYEFALRETKTHDIIEDVKDLRSEVGLLYFSRYNELIISKYLKEKHLMFTELFTAKPHIFVYKTHPLAHRKSLKLTDMEDYPGITFDQGEYSSFYFSEEIFSSLSRKKTLRVSDRDAMMNFMQGLNAYIIGTGVFPSTLHGNNIVPIPLNCDEIIRVGYILRKDRPISRLGEIYINALRKITQNLD